MRSFIASALLAALALPISGGVDAATITINTETGDAMETEFGFPAKTDTSTITRGVELAGATVTASFFDALTGISSTETVTWLAFDPYTTGGANGLNWSLYQAGDPTVSLVVVDRLMTSLEIDLSTSQSDRLDDFGVPVSKGASVFDATIANEENGDDGSTLGSSFGSAFEFTYNAPEGDVAVTYSGAVNIIGEAAKGDIFTTLFVDFTGLDAGGFTGSSLYSADQDTLAVRGDLVSVAAVPLPAGLPLLLASLGGLAFVRRRAAA